MTTTTIEIGTRVLRVTGGKGYEGDIGTAIEVTPERLRVQWDDKQFPNFYDASRGMVTRKGKRTWVKLSVVVVI